MERERKKKQVTFKERKNKEKVIKGLYEKLKRLGHGNGKSKGDMGNKDERNKGENKGNREESKNNKEAKRRGKKKC